MVLNPRRAFLLERVLNNLCPLKQLEGLLTITYGTKHAWPQPGDLVAWQSRGVHNGDYSSWMCPRGGCPDCVSPLWPATALRLLVQHQVMQLLVSLWWAREAPELVLKPSLKEEVCELQFGGHC